MEKTQQFKFIEVYHDTDGRCTKEESATDSENRAKILPSDLTSSEKHLFLLFLSSCFLGHAVLMLMATTALIPQRPKN